MSGDWGHVFRGEATVKVWTPAVAQVLAEQRITKLRINGWKQPTVEMLTPFRDQIVRIFWENYDDADTPDLSALAELHALSYLTLQYGLEQIDFSRLDALERLGVSSEVRRFGNLNRCASLRVLDVTNCGLRDLTPLAGLEHLAEFGISEAPLRSLAGANALRGLRRLGLLQLPLASLSGIESLQQLEVLYIYMLGRLEGIAPLTSLKRLRTLSIGAARKIADWDLLGEITSLESVELTGATPASPVLSRLTGLKDLRLINAGKLSSLSFLRGLDKLETFAPGEGTVIEDGDLSILLELPALKQVMFTNRRHYSHKADEIRAILASRHP